MLKKALTATVLFASTWFMRSVPVQAGDNCGSICGGCATQEQWECVGACCATGYGGDGSYEQFWACVSYSGCS